MIDLNDMPPCTNCYSTAHGVSACPDLAEPDTSSIQRFRDNLPPRSEDMMPKHPAEKEEIYWKGTCEIRDAELAHLRMLTEDPEWMRYKQMLNHANGQALVGHVSDPNGHEERRWSEEVTRITAILKGIDDKIKVQGNDQDFTNRAE